MNSMIVFDEQDEESDQSGCQLEIIDIGENSFDKKGVFNLEKDDMTNTTNNDDLNYQQYSTNISDQQSQKSMVEQRKRVGQYLFSEREPAFKSKESKLYIATTIKTHQLVAIRVIEKRYIGKYLQEKFQKEHKIILKQSSGISNNMVNFIDFFQTSTNFYLVYEYMQKGNLENYCNQFQKETKNKDEKIIKIMDLLIKSVAKIKQTLNYNQLGNLKLSNIFYDEDKNLVKIADFSKTYKNIKNELNVTQEMENTNTKDIIMVGVIMFQLFYGLNSSVFTRNQGSFSRYVERQTEKLEQNSEQFIQSCLFDTDFTWEKIEQFFKNKIISLFDLDSKQSLPEDGNIQQVQDKFQMQQQKSSSNDQQNIQIIETQVKKQDFSGNQITNSNQNLQKQVSNSNIQSISSQSQSKRQSFQDSQEYLQNNSYNNSMQLNPLTQQKFQRSSFRKNSNQFNKMSQKQRRSSFVSQLVIEDRNKISIQQKIKQQLLQGTQIKVKNIFKDYTYKYDSQKIQIQIHHEEQTKIYKKDEDFFQAQQQRICVFDLKLYENVQENINYKFEVIQEIDNQGFVDYYDNDENSIYDLSQYNFQIYQNLFKKKRSLFKVIDKKTKIPYVMKHFIPDDDTEFEGVIREIAILRYIDLHLYERIKITLDDDPQQDFLNCLNNRYKVSQQESIKGITNNYLKKLFTVAKQKTDVKRNKLQNLKDAFICKSGPSLGFYMIFEDISFTLKDYFLKNKIPRTQLIDKDKHLLLQIGLHVGILIQQLKNIGIAHNNIAPENIMFKLDKLSQKYTIILGNFEYCITKNQSFRKMYIQFDKDHENLKYKGPEISNILKFSEFVSEMICCNPVQSDMFSLGVMLKEIYKQKILSTARMDNIQEKLSFDKKDEELLLLLLNSNQQARMNPKKLIDFCDSDLDITYKMLNAKDFLNYEEQEMNELGETQSDISILVYAKCCRSLQVLKQAEPFLNHLKKKYIKSRSKTLESQLLEVYIYQELGNYYRDFKDKQSSIKCYIEAIQLLKNCNNQNIIEQANMYLEAAQLHEGCISWYKQSLSIMRKVYQTGNTKMIKLMVVYGEACETKGDHMTALHIYQEASIVLKNTIGFKAPLGIKLLDKLASLYYLISEYENSHQFFQKSLNNKIQIFPADHPSIAETMNNCAECLRMIGKYEEAEILYEKALRKLWKKRHLYKEFQAQIYNNMGICYKQAGKPSKAILLYEESYRLKREIYGEQHIQSLETLLNIGSLQDEKGCHTKGLLFYEEIIETLKATQQTDHVLYAEALQNKGIAYFNLAHYTKCIQLFNEALNIKRNIYGNMHVSVANTLSNLALVMHRQGQYKKALSMHDEVIKIYTRKLGPNHINVKQAQKNHAHTKKFAGQ